MTEQQAAQTDSLTDRIVAVIVRVGGLEPDEVAPDKSLADELDIDSLTLLEIALAIKSEFGVELPEEVLPDFHTIADVTGYVEARCENA